MLRVRPPPDCTCMKPIIIIAIITTITTIITIAIITTITIIALEGTLCRAVSPRRFWALTSAPRSMSSLTAPAHDLCPPSQSVSQYCRSRATRTRAKCRRDDAIQSGGAPQGGQHERRVAVGRLAHVRIRTGRQQHLCRPRSSAHDTTRHDTTRHDTTRHRLCNACGIRYCRKRKREHRLREDRGQGGWQDQQRTSISYLLN